MSQTKFNELQMKIHMVLDKLSNDQEVDIKEEWLDEAAESYKAALRKQLAPRKKEDFRLRMSNVGRPLCQLQHEKAGTPKSRQEYNHVIRMLLGDSVESIMTIVIKAAGINVTSQKDKVSLPVNTYNILGEDDIEIDGEVWDIKSSAPWAFENKWMRGWDSVFSGDSFGYVDQLYGYAKAKGKPMGGWIVINKASGEVLAVRAEPTPDQIKQIEARINYTERAISTDLPFKRGFQEDIETFRKKPTGNMTVPLPCTFCSYMHTDWPDAVRKPQAMSEAKNKKSIWYSKFTEQNTTDDS